MKSETNNPSQDPAASPMKITEAKSEPEMNSWNVGGKRERYDSLEVVCRTDIIKKRDMHLDDENLKAPVNMIPGEMLLYMGHTLNGQIMLTTYRLFVLYGSSFANIALRMIETVEIKSDVCSLAVLCKDATVETVTLQSGDACFKWYGRIKQEIAPVSAFEDHFAIAFYAKSVAEPARALWDATSYNKRAYQLGDEVERLGFDLKTTWRITNLNENYRYSSSYPQENLVPKDYCDDSLREAAQFRTLCRFPSAVWRNKENGTVLLRSSQPVVGVFCQRNTEDENLLQAIIRACGTERMLIVDARSYTAAIANRAKGGGCEYTAYYPNCDIEFMNLPNIHAIRSSFNAIRSLSSSIDSASWYSALDSTKWMLNLSTLLSSACTVVDNLTVRKRPVLVHCSDGWDRTPQLVSLSELILDPYYRTFKGFQVLVEREWLVYGHKFAERCGHVVGGSDPNEMSPVFIQWLDAVFQLLRQFPTEFEFNEAYLIKLVQHSHSTMFGTFLYNNEKERELQPLSHDTASVWSLLHAAKSQFTNRLYSSQKKVLDVQCHPRQLKLWLSVYSPQSSWQAPIPDEQPTLQRSHSFSEISTSTESDLHKLAGPRRLSDPDVGMSLSESPSLSSSQLPDSASHLSGSVNGSFGAGSNGTPSSHLDLLKLEGRSRNNSNASIRDEPIKAGDKQDMSQYSKYLDVDGLTLTMSPVQQAVTDMAASYEQKIEKLEKQIKAFKKVISADHNKLCNCNKMIAHIAQTDSENGTCSSGGSGNQSDSSWENVSHKESDVTLWMPDHAVSFCTSCNEKFYKLYRRKHHCRQCGQVFCSACADVFVPIPQQQLYEPARVCKSCYVGLFGSPNGANGAASPNSNGDNLTKNGAAGDAGFREGHALTDIVDALDEEPIALLRSERGSQLSLASNGDNGPTRNGVLSHKTCSQESINTDSSKEGHMRSTRAEC